MAYNKHTWVTGEVITAEKMNNIEDHIASSLPVFGHNIIRNSKPIVANNSSDTRKLCWAHSKSSHGSITFEPGKYIDIAMSASDSGTDAYSQVQKPYMYAGVAQDYAEEFRDIIPNTKMTLSFEIKSDIPFKLTNRILVKNSSNVETLRLFNRVNEYTEAIADWEKVSVTDTIPANFHELFFGETAYTSRFYFQTSLVTGGTPADGHIYIRNVKMEYGTEATPYSYSEYDKDLLFDHEHEIDTELNAVNSIPRVSIDYDRKPEGLLTNAFVAVPQEENLFTLFASQSKYVYDNIWRIRTIIGVPKWYSNKHLFKYLLTKNATSITEINVDNAATKGQGNFDYADTVHFHVMNVRVDDLEEGKYHLARLMLELNDGNGNVVERIYSKQLCISKVNGEYTYETVQYDGTTNDNCIVDGWLSKGSQGASFVRNNLSQCRSDYLSDFEYGVYGTNANTTYTQGRSKLIPWNLLSENNYIYPCLQIGKSTAVCGNVIKTHVPSLVMTKAVTTGQHFELDGLWYTATTNIAVGESLSIGTNCEAYEHQTHIEQ